MFCLLHCDSHSAYTIYDSIESVNTIWDSLLPQNHHLKSEFLLALERSQLAHIQYKYLIIENDKKQAIGLAYLQLLNFNSNHYNNEILKKPKLEHIKSYILKQNTNLLICGNLFKSNQQGFYFLNENDDTLILEVLKHFAKKNPYKVNFTGVLLKDCLVNFPENELSDNRYKHLPNDVSMKLYLKESWNNFEDYKASLSRKYLQRANKIRKAKEQLEVREFSIQEIESNVQILEQLYLNIASKQAIKMGLLNGQYFVEMKRALGDNYKVLGYYLEDKLVAFTSYILGKEEMEIHYIGIDYQYNEECKLYFNILFDGLESAIENRKTSLELGRTAREAKASLGAVGVVVKNYIWVKLGLPTLVYNYFQKWYNSHNNEDWKNRYPFRG